LAANFGRRRGAFDHRVAAGLFGRTHDAGGVVGPTPAGTAGVRVAPADNPATIWTSQFSRHGFLPLIADSVRIVGDVPAEEYLALI
jgi:hypothetical protein